jgi:trk system potassium uptake protein TrkA
MSRQQFVIIGLGGFGETIAAELTRLGHDVVGIDTDEKVVDRLADSITHAVVADGCDEKALEELNIANYDAAVVAIGENIEASLMTTLHLKSLGLKEVWVKALTADHHKILAKIGATRILHPEYEMGMRVAQALNHPMVNNYIPLGDDEFIVEIMATEKTEGKNMEDVLVEAEAEVRVLLVRRQGKTLVMPTQLSIVKQDHIILVGQLQELRKTAPFL